METQLEVLKSLHKELDHHIDIILDDFQEEGYCNKKHDVTITLGKKAFSLVLHADLYEELKELIESQIEQEYELKL